MALVNIEQLGITAKLTYTDGDVLYTWKEGRFYVASNNEDVESVNFNLSIDDTYHKQNFKYSEQGNVYGTANAIELVEYLILNEIFFSDETVEIVSLPEATKLTEVGKILYIAKAKAGSLYADPVWKCSKFDESVKTDQNMKWADGAKYTQIATDLTALTYL